MGLFDELSEEFLKFAVGKYTADEERDLVKQFQEGDMKAYRDLRRSYQGPIMNMIRQRLPKDGTIAPAQLTMVVERELPGILMKYDVGRGTQVNTHIFSHLPGIIGNAASEQRLGPYISRNDQSNVNELEKAIREAQNEHGPNPTDEQILKFHSKAKEVSEFAPYKKFLVTDRIGDSITQNSEGEGIAFNHNLTPEDTTVGEKNMDMRLNEALDVMRRNFSPWEFNVLKARLIDGQSMARVCADWALSTTKLSRLVSQWEDVRKREGLS